MLLGLSDPLSRGILAIWSSTGLSFAFACVWDGCVLRLRAPFKFMEIRSHKTRHQTRRIPLEPFGMRLAYVACNCTATQQFQQASLYVSIRLVQTIRRFISGPLGLYTCSATVPQVLRHAIRFHTFTLCVSLHYYMCCLIIFFYGEDSISLWVHNIWAPKGI